MKKLLSCLMAAALVALSVPPIRAGTTTDVLCAGASPNEFCIDEDANMTLPGTISQTGGTVVFNEDGEVYDVRIEGDTNTNLFLADGSTDRVGVNDSSPDAALDVNPNVATDTALTVMAALSQAVDILDVRSAEDTRMLRVDADGGVMIVDGSATPTTAVDAGDLYIEEQLEVDGAVDLDLTLTQAGGHVVFNEDSGLYDFRVEGDTNANLLFTDGSTDRVGVNDSSPDAALEVNPNVATDVVLMVSGMASQSGSIVDVRSNEDTVMLTVDADGGVTITDGSASPTTAVDAGDLYIEEQLEVDGAVDFDSSINIAGDAVIDGGLDVSGANSADTSLLVQGGAATMLVDILDVRSAEDTRLLRVNADGGVSIGDGDISPTTAVDAGDLYIEEQLEVDGAVDLDGSLDVAGTSTFGDALDINAAIVHDAGTVTINEAGGLYDFRVEGDTNANLITADASTDRVGVNVAAPAAALEVNPNVLTDTVLIVQGISSQTGDLLHIETDSADALRVLSNGGVKFRVYTEAQVTTLDPVEPGDMIQVSDFSSSASTSGPYTLCVNTSGIIGEYTVVGNTPVLCNDSN